MDQDTYTLDETTEAAALPPLSESLSPRDIRWQFSRLGVAVLVLTITRLAAEIGLDYLLDALIPGYASSWWRNWVLSLVPLYGVGLPCMLFALKGIKIVPLNMDFIRHGTGERTDKTRFTVGNFFILLIIGFGCMYVGSLLGNAVMLILTEITGYPYASALTGMVTESPLWMTFIGACICAPFGEELLFRKLLIDRSRRFGDTVSIVLSGLLFGLFHGNLFQFFYTFLFGMILAYIYTRTGKYLICVLMHAVVNFIGSILMPQLAELIPDTTDLSAFFNMTPIQAMAIAFTCLWVYGSIIGGTVLLIVFFRRRQLSRGSSPLNRRTAVRDVMANPGMLTLCLVLCAVMAISLIPRY